MTQKYQSLEQTAEERIRIIENTIAELTATVQHVKENGVPNWAVAGDLSHVAEQLNQVTRFWHKR